MTKSTILVVDDEEMVLEIADAMLDHLGYSAITANNGKNALVLFEKHQEKIDLVILDISMPDVNGFACLQSIRERSDVPVLLSSGLSQTFSQNDLQNHQAQGLLPKPFTLEILQQIIETVLPNPGSRPEIE